MTIEATESTNMHQIDYILLGRPKSETLWLRPRLRSKKSGGKGSRPRRWDIVRMEGTSRVGFRRSRLGRVSVYSSVLKSPDDVYSVSAKAVTPNGTS